MKYFNTKLHENPSSRGRVVACGQRDGQTDMTKLIIAFQNFAKAPKMAVKLMGFKSINKVKLLVQYAGVSTPREFLVQLIYWRDLKNYNVRGNSLSRWFTDDYCVHGNSLSRWSTDGFSGVTAFVEIPCTADLLTASQALQCSREFLVELTYWRALKNYCVGGNSLSRWSTDGLSRINVFMGIPCPGDLQTASQALLCSQEFLVQLIYWRLLKHYNDRGNSLSSWSTDVISKITMFVGIPCQGDLLTITVLAGIPCPSDLLTFSRITVFMGIPCPGDLLTVSQALLRSQEFFVQLIYWRLLKHYSVRGNSLSSWFTDVISRITMFVGIPCPSDLLRGNSL